MLKIINIACFHEIPEIPHKYVKLALKDQGHTYVYKGFRAGATKVELLQKHENITISVIFIIFAKSCPKGGEFFWGRFFFRLVKK